MVFEFTCIKFIDPNQKLIEIKIKLKKKTAFFPLYLKTKHFHLIFFPICTH
jgi:hypothetical protein